MNKKKAYSIKALADISGVTPRTLHYYDEIKLLVPERKQNGYRVYDQQHILRLQQILLHREMGLSLEEIRDVLDAEGFDYRTTLLAQRKQLLNRANSISEMINAIDAALMRLSKTEFEIKETNMTLFNGFEPEDYQAQAKKNWGDTPEYKQSTQRMATYGPEEIAAFKKEEAMWLERLSNCMRGKSAPNSHDAMALAEEHRLYIERWFYPCSSAMHKNLGLLYVSDDKFKDYYDEKTSGLAQFLHDAIHANALRKIPD